MSIDTQFVGEQLSSGNVIKSSSYIYPRQAIQVWWKIKKILLYFSGSIFDLFGTEFEHTGGHRGMFALFRFMLDSTCAEFQLVSLKKMMPSSTVQMVMKTTFFVPHGLTKWTTRLKAMQERKLEIWKPSGDLPTPFSCFWGKLADISTNIYSCNETVDT